MEVTFAVNIYDDALADTEAGSLIESREFTDDTEADAWGRAQQAKYAARPETHAELITWSDEGLPELIEQLWPDA